MLQKDINKEINDFQTRQIQIVPGLSFNQYETINKIYFYYNSKYVTGETDDEGDKKFFYNINKNPCKIYSKAIDFDTKNIRLLTVGGGEPIKTWFMERDLKFWMRDKQFGKVLNRIFKEIPIFGSVVLKIVDGEPFFVDLRNFVVEQAADCLDESNYIIEIHNYTPADFRKIAKKMPWKESDVKEVIDKFHQMKDTSHIRLFERYGEVEDEKGNWSYRRIFLADVGLDEFDQSSNKTLERPGVLLSTEEWDGNPYWEFHADKMPGRWLGIGTVEELFEPQIAQNQNTNLQNKSSFWAALKVFQTRDPSINRNLMTDTRNGEVMNVENEITPINMASSENLAFFNQQDQRWMKNRDELTFSYDVVQGERLPAGTPLGSAQIAMTQTLSYFEMIQENIAMDVKEMLYQVIIPQFEKESSIEHTIRLVGKDLDEFADMVKNEMVMKEIIRQAVAGKGIPSEEEKNMVELAVISKIKKDKELLEKIPKGFYKDIKYDVDIDITGESIDTRVKNATLFAILQAITADPTMTQDPTKKKILYYMAENGGINPNEIFPTETNSQNLISPETQTRAGGGVSAPVMEAGKGQGEITI